MSAHCVQTVAHESLILLKNMSAHCVRIVDLQQISVDEMSNNQLDYD